MTKAKGAWKRALCALLAAVLLGALQRNAPEQRGSLAAFAPLEKKTVPVCTDVAEDAWYAEAAALMIQLELMAPEEGGNFAPDRPVMLEEAAALAAGIFCRYYGITRTGNGMEQAASLGLLPEELAISSGKERITRGEAAEILYRCLPEKELTPINEIAVTPDLQSGAWAGSVLTLYRAGIFRGRDSGGNFAPDRAISRAELAEAAARLVQPDRRVRFRLTGMNAFLLPEEQTAAVPDVTEADWYYEGVRTVLALGLMAAKEDGSFAPRTAASLEETAAMACAVYAGYWGLNVPEAETVWDRALEWRLLPLRLQHQLRTRPVTRGEAAEILYRCLPEAELTPVNHVTALPDCGPEENCCTPVLALYNAGVLRGSGRYGAFYPGAELQRGELAALTTRLVCPALRVLFELEEQAVRQLTYGESAEGRALTAWQLGSGENTLLLTFAIHGYEDAFDRDGKVLTELASSLLRVLRQNYELLDLGSWTVYILPCLNPDGLEAGWTCDGPGRCTLWHDGAEGLVSGGVDLNRCFPANYRRLYGSRNYNGTEPLQAPEARALAEFTQSVMGTGKNYCIDAHGWYQQIIVSHGRGSILYRVFHDAFPKNSYAGLSGAVGYFSTWAASVGYEACLFEFPVDVTCEEDFYRAGYDQAYISAILNLLTA